MKRRNIVLGLLCGLSVITFLDRLALPLAEPGIRGELHLSPRQWGWVLSAYVLANALFEIPSGMLGDRHGRRKELTRIVGWWSAFTALTAWCRSFWQIAAARFFFGIGAAGAYPNAAGVVGRWFPRSEHAKAQGYIWGASRIGGALAPLLLVPAASLWGWRSTFWIMGVIGLLWSVVWWTFFRDAPEAMRGITEEELGELRSSTITAVDLDPRELLTQNETIPWRRLLRLPHLWLLVCAYFVYAWGSWFFFGWFPIWLVHGAGFTTAQMGLFASLPFLMGAAGNFAGGALSERLVLRYGRAKSYRYVTAVCLSCAGCLLQVMSLVHGHATIILLASCGFGVMDLMLPAAWAMCMSLGGSFSGTATGLMNTAGNLGGWLCTVAFGYIVAGTGNYNLPVRVIAAMVLLAALLFACVDCTRGLKEADASLPHSI